VQSFQVQWIAKASANQRAGRAGRTGPGHCYRLYSSALFEDHFESFSPPEISRMPIEGVVLQMKSMGIEQVVNFPFPTPPDRYALGKAEELLRHLGALSNPGTSGGGAITELGRQMSQYPVSPRFAKMLAIGNQHGCLPYVVAIVAGMSGGDPFIHESAIEADEDEGDKSGDELSYIDSEKVREKEERKRARKRYFASQAQFQALGGGMSDVFKLLSAVGAFEYDPTADFCAKNFLRLKAMQEIELLRKQITGIAGAVDKGKAGVGRLAPPNDTQVSTIFLLRNYRTTLRYSSKSFAKSLHQHSSTSSPSGKTCIKRKTVHSHRAAPCPIAYPAHPSLPAHPPIRQKRHMSTFTLPRRCSTAPRLNG
jgi:ATP-dependent RNA helicase DHX37/DHR1